MPLLDIFILYCVFRIKQLFCDYFLQTSNMALNKGRPFNQGGFFPLVMHAGIHGIVTIVLMMYFAPILWWLGCVDFIIHGAVDKATAHIGLRKKWTPNEPQFWWALGIDQEIHNFTHLGFIVCVVYFYQI